MANRDTLADMANRNTLANMANGDTLANMAGGDPVANTAGSGAHTLAYIEHSADINGNSLGHKATTSKPYADYYSAQPSQPHAHGASFAHTLCPTQLHATGQAYDHATSTADNYAPTATLTLARHLKGDCHHGWTITPLQASNSCLLCCSYSAE